jgi:hypothetical protein
MKASLKVCIVIIAFGFAACNSHKDAKSETKATKHIHSIAGDSLIFIKNADIEVAINLNRGGAITYVADPANNKNLVNNYDMGRQIQMSFYAYPVPFTPDGKKPFKAWKGLGWNPIQVGDAAGNRSKVLDYKKTDNSLYVKTRPMQWPLHNRPCQCTFEEWIKLDNNTVKVTSQLNNAREDTKQYPARPQELPAVYTNGAYHNIVTYKGTDPFENDKIYQFPNKPAPPWSSWLATEHWAATLNDNNWGLGIWEPEITQFSGGFAEKPKDISDSSSEPTHAFSTAYISPHYTEILDHNIVYRYKYVLILGTLKQIRHYAYAHSNKHYVPAYTFKKNRQHWTYKHAHDTGWPIEGQLNITLDNRDAMILGPTTFWKAKRGSELTMKAAFKTSGDSCHIFWKTFNSRKFTQNKSLSFKVKSDGRFHTYKLDLSKSPCYKGSIIQMAIQPKEQAGDKVKIKSIKIH